MQDFDPTPHTNTSDLYTALINKISSTIDCIQYSLSLNHNNNKKPSNDHPPQPPWWNSNCIEVNNCRKKALKNFRKNPNIINELIAAEQQAKVTFRNAKRDGFKTFCESINPFTSITQIWTTIKKFRHRSLTADSALNNNKNIEQMHNLIPSLCPQSCFKPFLLTSFSPTPECKNFFSKPFTHHELNAAINICRKKINSAPGLDKIDNFILTNLPDNIYEILLQIFNEVLNNGFFPTSWNDFKIFFIPKGNRANSAQSP
ncbi:hypothetical protein TKK_0011882 [Trichogramma kaykai]|uniref:Reverse transcriptase domain-containing protein n=1 Tax=Trichogramma kaykai TaxID=54128 RepID=A0ABD2WQG5_9HYME